MKLRITNWFSDDWLIEQMRAITLLNSKIRPYQGADIRFETINPDFLFPAANYVTRKGVEFQRELRGEIFRTDQLMGAGVSEVKGGVDREGGADTLNLSGFVQFIVEDKPDEVWGIMPPLVEFQSERVRFENQPCDLAGPTLDADIPVIADGLHRVTLARELKMPVRVIVVRNAIPEFPYYAYPSSWSKVKVTDAVPEDKSLRKSHRIKDHYSLYRDFGPLGVGKPRHPAEIKI